MKITPKPIAFSDQVDQSRDISGLNKWSQSSRTIGFIMFVLGWFTIPVEVLLRRDFGQRWFTVVNFYAGFFLLLIFATLQYFVGAIWAWIQNFISQIASAINPLHTDVEQSFADDLINSSMLLLLIAYMLLGSYHLFKIWWRNKANTALHSFDDGISRTEPLAGILMRVVNMIAIPFVYFYRLLLPKSQREGVSTPKLINNRTAFTNTVFEPLLLIVLGYELDGIVSLWLFLSAIALAIHANWKETAKLNKILDFRDSMIDAKTMRHLKEGAEVANSPVQGTKRQKANAIQNIPPVKSQMTPKYPDLMSIIEEMNSDKSHLAN